MVTVPMNRLLETTVVAYGLTNFKNIQVRVVAHSYYIEACKPLSVFGFP